MSGSAIARGPEDEQTWEKAKRDLAEAEALDASRTPGAAVHKAYYAMHHAARAVLLRRDGAKAPNKHAAVIGRVGMIAKAETEGSAGLLQAGRDLNRVYAARADADYGVEATTTREEAEACVSTARQFLRACSEHFGFRLD